MGSKDELATYTLHVVKRIAAYKSLGLRAVFDHPETLVEVAQNTVIALDDVPESQFQSLLDEGWDHAVRAERISAAIVLAEIHGEIDQLRRVEVELDEPTTLTDNRLSELGEDRDFLESHRLRDEMTDVLDRIQNRFARFLSETRKSIVSREERLAQKRLEELLEKKSIRRWRVIMGVAAMATALAGWYAVYSSSSNESSPMEPGVVAPPP